MKETVVKHGSETNTAADEFLKSQPDKPCCKPRDSLFSWSSGFRSFTGFVNWAFLLLFVGGLRLMLENLIKYGIRVDPPQWLVALNAGTSGIQEGYPSVWMIISLNVQILFAFILEKLLLKDQISWKLARFLRVANLASLIFMPVVAINLAGVPCGLVGATSVCMMCSITFLKLWSYAHVNYWCRQAMNHHKQHGKHSADTHVHANTTKDSDGLVRYPDNLNLKDMYYFMIAPSLCYQLNFPRTSRIRKRFLIRRIIETVVGFHVILALLQQWIIPSMKNSLVAIAKMEAVPALERLLKLAIPNHLIWLIFFYLLFHSYLNLVAELLRFADREFYLDWWNARNVDVFWRTWNIPAHRWAFRHLYLPLIQMGCGKHFSSTAVFFVSACFHEFLVSVPLRMFRLWAFTGMMSQVPLLHLTKKVDHYFGPRVGNVMVWMSVILGQPLCIMAYYHDYVVTHLGSISHFNSESSDSLILELIVPKSTIPSQNCVI